MNSDPLVIAGRTFRSRLIVGTGKYPSHAGHGRRARRVGAEMVTVAVRRVNLLASGRSLSSGASRSRCSTTSTASASSSCRTPPAATPRTMRSGRRGSGARSGLSNWVKLEVIGDEQTLFPDNVALLEATRVLVEGRLRRAALHERRSGHLPEARGRRGRGGDAARRADRLGPRASRTRTTSASSRTRRACPVIVDAGVGTASDAAIAMELGADGVLMNTAIALAQDPGRDGRRDEARGRGRADWRSWPVGFRAGSIASASSPIDGLIGRPRPPPNDRSRSRTRSGG